MARFLLESCMSKVEVFWICWVEVGDLDFLIGGGVLDLWKFESWLL